MRTKILLILLFLFSLGISYGQNTQSSQHAEAGKLQGETIVFRFVAEDDTFFIPYQGNGDKLSKLVAAIDYYKNEIEKGQAKINVAGYCSSYVTAKENLNSAAVRANRVKSELIVRNGIKEANFHTSVHTGSYEGWKSVVVVTLHVAQISEPKPEPRPEPVVVKPEPRPEPKPEPVVESKPEPAISTIDHADKPILKADYRLAIRTNLLYDAFLLPTLGVEWRISDRYGVKLDGSRSWWGSKTGKVQKIWMLSPEVRYYMGGERRWYVGASGNFGKYNIYKGMLGNLISKDTGYQGSMWNAGAVAGYQLPLNRTLTLDFNIGLGYGQYKYDSFNMVGEVRVNKESNKTKNFFGPTQAGVNLTWTIGGSK